GTSWVKESIDTSGDVGAWCSLAIAPGDVPHVAYYDATNANLKYAVRTGGVWTPTTVDAPGNVGEHTSISIDSTGKPAIAYRDVDNYDLKLARLGASWTT